ncbi:LysR substrate-binding domain-containing protein [Embleya sp. NPDC008237]|uniref:LysR substrate-binding domain-containing protein n=1 Tax=Embleya sp. NPDC008237 TaxID=3363978 RepID=UPI0036E2C105
MPAHEAAVAAETLPTVTELLARFHAEYPGVDVRLVQADADAMVRRPGDREVDMCLASQPLTGPSLSPVHSGCAIRIARREMRN